MVQANVWFNIYLNIRLDLQRTDFRAWLDALMAKEGLVPRAAGTASGTGSQPAGPRFPSHLPETERMRLQWSLGLLGTNPQVMFAGWDTRECCIARCKYLKGLNCLTLID
jgi:hypothetical protein